MQQYFVRLVLAYVAFGRAYPAGTPGQMVNASIIEGIAYVSFYGAEAIPVPAELLEKV